MNKRYKKKESKLTTFKKCQKNFNTKRSNKKHLILEKET